jgi:hypothetical protein
MCVCPRLQDHLSGDEVLWRSHCESRYLLRAPCNMERMPLATWRAAFKCWQASMGRYKELATRAITAWRKIEDWMEANDVGIRWFLCEGAYEEDLNYAERRNSQKIPTPVSSSLYVFFSCCLYGTRIF